MERERPDRGYSLVIERERDQTLVTVIERVRPDHSYSDRERETRPWVSDGERETRPWLQSSERE